MHVISTVAELRRARAAMPEPVGLVPTMGYLHEGHLSLVRRSFRENMTTIVTIFVNPTQFAPTEDLGRYPRDMPRDLERLRSVGARVVFAPPTAEVYPAGYRTFVTVDDLTTRLEGAARGPEHFRGVATVVAKLFNLTRPTRAYFGQKDAQQLRVIRQMARDLDFDVQVVPCPTVREADGLAMSSRNVYLQPDERRAATVLYRALQAAQARFAAGERNAEALRRAMRAVLDAEPRARVDYVSVADDDTLVELQDIAGRALASLAVFIGTTRLIDNVTLGEASA